MKVSVVRNLMVFLRDRRILPQATPYSATVKIGSSGVSGVSADGKEVSFIAPDGKLTAAPIAASGSTFGPDGPSRYLRPDNNNAGTLDRIQRPNLVAGVDPCTSGSTTQRLNNWFNAAACTQAAAFTLGNAPRTLDCRLPAQKNMDVAIRKNTPITEKTRASFRL